MLDQILQNSSDNIDIEIYKDDVKIDPDGNAVTVTITDPNGDVLYSGTTATRHSIGRYYITLAAGKTDVLGKHTAVWSFAISSDAMEHTQYFQVVSAVKSGYLLPSEYRDLTTLDVSSKTNSDLDKYIYRATDLIESYLGGVVRMTSYEEKVRCVIDYPNEGLHMQLKHAPIDAVTSAIITFRPDYTVTLTLSKIRIFEKPGYLEYFGLNLTTSLTACTKDLTESTIRPIGVIKYSAGYNEIPDKVERATVRLVDQLINLETKEFREIGSVSLPGYSESFKDSSGKLGVGRIGDDEVVELLREYRHPTASNIKII